MNELKMGKKSPWQCLDIQLSVQISNKVAAAKKDPNTPPILMQLAQTILTEKRIAQSNKRFLTGREMIRHIGTWAAVKCEHGQKYNIADLLRMRLKDNNPDEDLRVLLQMGGCVHTAVRRNGARGEDNGCRP